MKTIFIVIEVIEKTYFQSIKSSSRGYSIDMRDTCEEKYTYSKNVKEFE